MSTQVRSYSKINLGLAIGPPRPDGFHFLSTVYQTLELHDVVTVDACRSTKASITLTTNDDRVPTDNRNTAWKILEIVLEELGITAEVCVHIEKRLPVQGGLGAGSANAIAALIGLERELGTQLPGAERLRLAAKIGSDVPLFLIGGSILGVNRGEEVYPLPDLPATWCVIASPSIGVSTPQAFRDWDALCRQGGPEELTPDAEHDRLAKSSRVFAHVFAEAGSSGVLSLLEEGLAENPLLALVRTGIENDFERVVFPQYPSLGRIKRVLAAQSQPEAAVYAALSGSGSALFGLYPSQETAEAALKRLSSEGVPGYLTRTLPRKNYWREMVVGS
jgi:4-diphosphocytidyl-2-C-methyl-D-erythritol kinase